MDGYICLTIVEFPPTSASAAEAIMCIIILYYVCIVPFYGGGRCGSFVGSNG